MNDGYVGGVLDTAQDGVKYWINMTLYHVSNSSDESCPAQYMKVKAPCALLNGDGDASFPTPAAPVVRHRCSDGSHLQNLPPLDHLVVRPGNKDKWMVYFGGDAGDLSLGGCKLVMIIPKKTGTEEERRCIAWDLSEAHPRTLGDVRRSVAKGARHMSIEKTNDSLEYVIKAKMYVSELTYRRSVPESDLARDWIKTPRPNCKRVTAQYYRNHLVVEAMEGLDASLKRWDKEIGAWLVDSASSAQTVASSSNMPHATCLMPPLTAQKRKSSSMQTDAADSGVVFTPHGNASVGHDRTDLGHFRLPSCGFPPVNPSEFVINGPSDDELLSSSTSATAPLEVIASVIRLNCDVLHDHELRPLTEQDITIPFQFHHDEARPLKRGNFEDFEVDDALSEGVMEEEEGAMGEEERHLLAMMENEPPPTGPVFKNCDVWSSGVAIERSRATIMMKTNVRKSTLRSLNSCGFSGAFDARSPSYCPDGATWRSRKKMRKATTIG